ncbi:DUF6682 family protein [Desulfovibrio inopinatus]|uniref:DUF6682 family protein n=1 Tax=Desulfovibrio inopinatus TaxID=102109 RepID=UPI0004019624|nr:DUF6682 family protein [Desulfovibrio inopinatus]
MSVRVADILWRMAQTMNDEDHLTWTWAEKLDGINAAQRLLVLDKPDATATRTILELRPGTQQTIPDDGIMLLRLIRNIGSLGGQIITLTDWDALGVEIGNWMQLDASSVVRNYLFDQNQPTAFDVLPPNDGTGQVELIYSRAPNPVAVGQTVFQAAYGYPLDWYVAPNAENGMGYRTIVAGSAGSTEPTWPTTVGETVTSGAAVFRCEGQALLDVPDTYVEFVFFMAMAMCYFKEAAYAGNVSQAQLHAQTAYSLIGLKEKAESFNNPNAKSLLTSQAAKAEAAAAR